MNIDTKVKGIVNLKIVRNGVCHTDVTFENLILDTFFNRFAANNILFNTIECQVGTGTTPPANSDTVLVSKVAQLNANITNLAPTIDAVNNRFVAALTCQWQFPIGAVAANIGELGFVFALGVSGANMNQLNSRVLTKDSGGTPTVYPITAGDQLIVNYRFEVWIPLVDYTATLNISGVDYNVIGRIGDITSSNQSPGNVLRLPVIQSNWLESYGSTSVFGNHGVAPTAGSGTSANTQTDFINISGGKEVEMTATINQLNASGGIKCLTIPSGAGSGKLFKYQFTPVIPKTNLKIFKIRFRMTCSRA